MLRVPFAKPDMTESEAKAAYDQVLSGKLTGCGKVTEFEEALKDFLGADRVVCLDSNTAAIELCLKAMGIGRGHKVATTPFTYSATADAPINLGAHVKFIDLERGTFEMDYDMVPGGVSAVIPVDYAGIPCDYKRLRGYDGLVIADAAHSFGATINGKRVWEDADFMAFSFHAVKGLTTGGEGGALVWNDLHGVDNNELEDRIRLLADHGQTRKGMSGIEGREWEYNIECIGKNHIMTDVDAAIGIEQLKSHEKNLAERERVAKLYYRHLPGEVDYTCHHGEGWTSAMHLFPIKLRGFSESMRNRVYSYMKSHGIDCNVHYKPLPMMTAYRNLSYDISYYPEAYAAYCDLLTLPFYGSLGETEVKVVCSTLKEAIDAVRK